MSPGVIRRRRCRRVHVGAAAIAGGAMIAYLAAVTAALAVGGFLLHVVG
jgi:hypothetical protein